MAVKDSRFLLSLTSRDKDMLRRVADHHDVSMSEVIRVLIRREAKTRLNKKRRVVKRIIRRV